MPAKEGLPKKPEKYTQKCRKRQPERDTHGYSPMLADARSGSDGKAHTTFDVASVQDMLPASLPVEGIGALND